MSELPAMARKKVLFKVLGHFDLFMYYNVLLYTTGQKFFFFFC